MKVVHLEAWTGGLGASMAEHSYEDCFALSRLVLLLPRQEVLVHQTRLSALLCREQRIEAVERMTGFEPATFTLAR